MQSGLMCCAVLCRAEQRFPAWSEPQRADGVGGPAAALPHAVGLCLQVDPLCEPGWSCECVVLNTSTICGGQGIVWECVVASQDR